MPGMVRVCKKSIGNDRLFQAEFPTGDAVTRSPGRYHPLSAKPQTSFANGRASDGVLRFRGSEIDGYAVTTGALADTLSGVFSESVERPVLDKTGLQGRYDIHLKWAADKAGGTSANAVGKDGQPVEEGPSIFTALQEELGLKLEPATETRQVLVVDEAGLPSPN